MRIFADLAWGSVPDLDLLRGVQRFATTRRAWQILVPGWDGEAEDLMASADGLLLRNPRHPLLTNGGGKAPRRPCVLISGNAVPRTHRVWHDDEAIATTAADYLLGLGFRHFLLRDDTVIASLHVRMTRFAAAVRRAASSVVRYEPTPVMRQHYTIAGETALLQLVLANLPTERRVLVAYDSLTARRLQNGLQALGRQVPEEVAVFALEDQAVVGVAAHPPISAVRIDLGTLGYSAAQQLDRVIAKGRPERLLLVPPRGIVERGSAEQVLPSGDPVLLALRLIRESPERAWPVDELAARAGVSRRALERAFRQDLGSSPAAEAARIRLEHAAILLANGRLPIADIAQRCGFSSHSRFCHAFRRQHHLTPQQYRLHEVALD